MLDFGSVVFAGQPTKNGRDCDIVMDTNNMDPTSWIGIIPNQPRKNAGRKLNEHTIYCKM